MATADTFFLSRVFFSCPLGWPPQLDH